MCLKEPPKFNNFRIENFKVTFDYFSYISLNLQRHLVHLIYYLCLIQKLTLVFSMIDSRLDWIIILVIIILRFESNANYIFGGNCTLLFSFSHFEFDSISLSMRILMKSKIFFTFCRLETVFE